MHANETKVSKGPMSVVVVVLLFLPAAAKVLWLKSWKTGWCTIKASLSLVTAARKLKIYTPFLSSFLDVQSLYIKGDTSFLRRKFSRKELFFKYFIFLENSSVLIVLEYLCEFYYILP